MAAISAAPSLSTDPVSTTVEMSDLESSSKAKGGPESTSQDITSANAKSPSEPTSTNNAILPQGENAQQYVDEEQSRTSINTPAVTATAAPTAVESEANPTIDSTTLGSAAAGSSLETSGPVCIITLLLTSGARHPYKLDEKYLIKRNVNVPGTTESGRKDPFSISVYTLKELILREWRDEWETQPSSPSSIRLIHFGRLLDDKMPLKECRFNTDSPNVVHMTVKPQEVVDEEDASKAKAMGRDGAGSERTAGCRCIIM